MDFARRGCLGKLYEYKSHFADPIKDGAAADATDEEVEQMLMQAHILHRALKPIVLYRGHIPGEVRADNQLSHHLNTIVELQLSVDKKDYAILVRLTSLQHELCERAKEQENEEDNKSNVLVGFHTFNR